MRLMALPAAARMVRPWLLAAALVAAVVLLAHRLTRPVSLSLPLNDFVQYWAAGRLTLAGDNPYDPARVDELERAAGRDAGVLMMWNPPWTLPLLLPFALPDPCLAYLLWMAALLAALAGSAVLLWRYYGGPAEQTGTALVVAFTFVPTFLALLLAQISPFLLLGAALFLHLERRGRYFLAGAAAALMAVKPHLTYLFWPALALWSLDRRRWPALAGAAAAGLGATLVALAFNPDVIGQFVRFFTSSPPAQYRSPTLGTLLRLALGEGDFRLQYLALLPGFAWFAWYWLRRRRAGDWGRDLPVLLFASLLTAAYGAWPYDLVLLLVPVVQVAAGAGPSRRCALAAHGAVNGAAAVMVVFLVNFLWFLWMTPALLLAYLVALRRRASGGRPPHCPDPGAEASRSPNIVLV
jgi:hypothetical protein